jgi:hypothetical protein
MLVTFRGIIRRSRPAVGHSLRTEEVSSPIVATNDSPPRIGLEPDKFHCPLLSPSNREQAQLNRSSFWKQRLDLKLSWSMTSRSRFFCVATRKLDMLREQTATVTTLHLPGLPLCSVAGEWPNEPSFPLRGAGILMLGDIVPEFCLSPRTSGLRLSARET